MGWGVGKIAQRWRELTARSCRPEFRIQHPGNKPEVQLIHTTPAQRIRVQILALTFQGSGDSLIWVPSQGLVSWLPTFTVSLCSITGPVLYLCCICVSMLYLCIYAVSMYLCMLYLCICAVSMYVVSMLYPCIYDVSMYLWCIYVCMLYLCIYALSMHGATEYQVGARGTEEVITLGLGCKEELRRLKKMRVASSGPWASILRERVWQRTQSHLPFPQVSQS